MSATAAAPPALFCEGLREAFTEAAAQTALVERDVRAGDVTVRLRFAGDALAHRLLPALRTGVASGNADLVIDAFDTASSGVPAPRPPWDAAAYAGFEEVAGWSQGDYLAAYSLEHATLSVLDRANGRGTFWSRDADRLPDWEEGAPLRHLLRWALARRGLHLLHAGAAGGVLLLGDGGAGKSTTALALLEMGLPFAGDDYVLVGDDDVARPLYAIAKAGERTLDLLPGLRPFAGPLRGPKHKSHLAVGERIAESVALRAIVLPRVASRTGSPVRVDGARAVRAVLASTLAQMPGERAVTLGALGALARRLPCYALEVGPDIGEAARRVAALGG